MNYYDAARIRKKGFANLMADKLASGQGIVSSLRGTLSDRSKAKSMAMKEKFDPMNIAKFLTGGSNLAPAIVGRLTGRSKEDIGYFTGKKQYQYAPRQSSYWQRWNNPNMGGSRKATEVLEKIVSFMEKSREDDVKEQEILDTYNELNEKMKLDNHKEVINVFKEAIKNKRKAMKEMAKEAKKRQAQEKAKEKTEQKKTEVKKEEPKPEAPKPEAPKPQAPKPEAPKPEAPKPQAPKPEAPKPEAPKPEAPKPQAPKPEAPKPEAPKPTAKPVEPTPPAPPTAAPAPPTVTPKPPVVKPAITEAAKTAAKIAVTAGGVFATSDVFAKTMFPYARLASQKLGGKIPPEAILAQWAGESDNGKSLSASFNYAGIKAGPNDKKGDYVLTEERYTPEQIKRAQQKGETLERVLGPNDTITKKGRQVTVDQWFGKGSIEKAQSEGKQWVQVRSYFSKYDNFDEFVNGYVNVLSQNRYKLARESSDSVVFGLEVAKAGYATASAQKYSEHIGSYIRQNSELLNNISRENADMKKDMSQSPQGASTMVNQNNITNRQRNITVTSPPIEELNPRMRR